MPYVNFQGEFNQNHLDRVGVSHTTTTVNLFILQTRLALNPRVQFTGIYQRNSLNHSDNYNLRLAWEFHPLSYVYLIYNRGSTASLASR